jgi:3',5'-cyclic AMP phosphodiesterase CpdA
VQHINALTKADGIDFVIVSGDLTDSGEKSEFLHFKKLMDSLNVPYFPLMGNHDAWSYNRFGDEAKTACGDSLMNEVFEGTFAGLNGGFTLRSSLRNNAWWNAESSTFAYLQNFHYSHKGFSFIFLDFNPRYHVRKDEPGIGPEAQLMEGAGGTFEFLKNALATAKQLNERVVLISHHPPIASIVGFHYAFTAKEKTQLARVIKPYRKLIDGWFAGHIHRHANYKFTKASGLKIFETKANKSQDFGGFRVVKVQQ